MDSQLNTEARARLRLFLRTHFNLEELRDLAFDLGISFEADIKVGALSREIIEDSDRKESLSCLIKEVMVRRSKVDMNELVKMLAKLPPCKQRVKVQVISHGIDKVFPPELLAKIAEWAGTQVDDVELIGAAPGSIRLLTSLSEAKAESLLEFRPSGLIVSHNKARTIKNFRALTPLAQITWRVLVVYSPFSKLSLLETGLSWWDVAALVKSGQAVTADINPEIPRPALFNYFGGLLLLKLKKWESAILNFSRSLEIMPHFAEAHLRRGIACDHLGQYGPALADYEAAIKYDPTLVEAYNYRGALHAKVGDNNKALADFNQALQLDPESSISYTNRGSVLYRFQQHKAALADFNQAISLDPLNKRAYVCRGFIWGKLRRNLQSLSDFNRAIDLDPHDAQTYIDRGIIYERLGRNEDAVLDIQTALRLDPNNKKADKIRQELNAANDEASSIYPTIVGSTVEMADIVEVWPSTTTSAGEDQPFETSVDIETEY